MTTFSELYGYKPDRSRLHQFEEMDDRLKNTIWNFLSPRYFAYEYDSMSKRTADTSMKEAWTAVIGGTIDDLTSGYHALVQIRTWYFNAAWHEVYDVLQHLVRISINKRIDTGDANDMLRREGSAYRFIGGVIAPLTNDDELAEVEVVLHHTGPFGVASQHIKQAVTLMSDRDNPDARNAIKESISAVESAIKVALGDQSADIKEGAKKLGVHHQLAQGWSNLYNWTSNEGGLRHGNAEMSQVGLAEARYMAVACSAFVNYLIAKHAEGDRR